MSSSVPELTSDTIARTVTWPGPGGLTCSSSTAAVLAAVNHSPLASLLRSADMCPASPVIGPAAPPATPAGPAPRADTPPAQEPAYTIYHISYNIYKNQVRLSRGDGASERHPAGTARPGQDQAR